jgi:hypothetical protein
MLVKNKAPKGLIAAQAGAEKDRVSRGETE